MSLQCKKFFIITLFMFLTSSALIPNQVNAESFFPAEINNKLINCIVLYAGSPLAYVNNCEVLIDKADLNIVPQIKNGKLLAPLNFLNEKIGTDANPYIIYYDSEIIENNLFIPVKAFANALGKSVFFHHGLMIIGDKNNIFNPETNQTELETIINFFVKKRDINVPILLYHSVDSPIPKGRDSTTVTPEEFESQISYLLEQGYTSINFQELSNYLNGIETLPEKPFMITFDDGYFDNYLNTFDFLKSSNVYASIFILPSIMGQKPSVNLHFNWEQAKEMQESGLIDIFSHGFKHEKYDTLSEAEIVDYVIKAQDIIDKNLGKKDLKVFSYPGGKNTLATRKILANLGYDIQLTGLNKLVGRYSDPTDINRINVTHGMTGQDIIEKIGLAKTKKLIDKTPQE